MLDGWYADSDGEEDEQSYSHGDEDRHALQRYKECVAKSCYSPI